MGYDSADTRRRLLDAAYAEFSERGLAGARVDRVAAEAGANKQAIYAHFSSKEGLFDAVLETRLGILTDQVPFSPDAFGDYILALFDHMIEHPALVRLTLWKLLERPVATEREVESHTTKAREIARVLGREPTRGMDVLMLTLAMAQAWNTTTDEIRRVGGSTDARLAEHRAALVVAIAAAVAALD